MVNGLILLDDVEPGLLQGTIMGPCGCPHGILKPRLRLEKSVILYIVVTNCNKTVYYIA